MIVDFIATKVESDDGDTFTVYFGGTPVEEIYGLSSWDHDGKAVIPARLPAWVEDVFGEFDTDSGRLQTKSVGPTSRTSWEEGMHGLGLFRGGRRGLLR